MADELSSRELAVLRHIGLYRVGLNPVLSALFFDGSGPTCGIWIKRLSEPKGSRRGLLQAHGRALPGNISYATLNPPGCKLIGVSAKRANPLGTGALNVAIGLSYFCCRGKIRRHRVERAELLRLLGDDTPPDNVFHVVTEELDYPCLLRVYQVTRNVESLVKAIRRDFSEAKRRPVMDAWISAGDYGAAVLVPWPDKVANARETIERSRLMDDCAVVVGLGPTASTLHAALKHEG